MPVAPALEAEQEKVLSSPRAHLVMAKDKSEKREILSLEISQQRGLVQNASDEARFPSIYAMCARGKVSQNRKKKSESLSPREFPTAKWSVCRGEAKPRWAEVPETYM